MSSRKIVILENTYYTVLSLRMEILRYFKENGFEIYVLSKAEQSDVEVLTADGFICRPVGSVVLNPFKAILYILNLFREIQSIQPCIIFSFTIRPNIFGSIVARLLNIPIVSNVTGTGPLTTDGGNLYSLIRFVYKLAFLKNQRVFFQNRDDYNFFLQNKYVTPSQAKLLPGSGIDTDYYIPRPKISNTFSFLMISRLIKDKGVIEYIEAARIVKRQFPNINFQLLGPYWRQSRKQNTITSKEVAKWEAEGVINYLGYTLDVRPFIAESEAIVLPSYREGCANVLMQGAAMARPLIASNVTGCANLIEDETTGYLCEVKNSEDLAEKMIKIYNLPEEKRQELGLRGRQKMIKEYRKTIVLDAYWKEVSG